MTKNFAANLKIGAALSSSVNRVFGGLKSKIKEQEAVLKGLRSAYEDASKGVGEYAGKLDELKRKTAEAERELKRLKAAANYSIGGGFKSIGSTFVKDAGRLAAGAGIATAAVTALGAAVYSTTRGFVDWADDIGDSAEALGMSTQALQTWQFAAATMGVDDAKMTASIAKFSKAVMEGGESTDEALGKLGFNASRLRKLKLDQQLEAVAEAFKDYKGADKAALAMKLFGKSGYQLAGILSKGKDGLDEFRKAGEETGAVLTDEAAKAAGDAASALDMFGITMIGLRNTIAIQFVPTLTRLAERFTTFVRENGPQIREWATKFAGLIETRVVPALGKLLDKLPGMIDRFATFATKAWDVTTAVKDFVGGWENLGIVLVTANFAPTIVSIAQLAKGMWGLAGASWAATGPVGLIVLALGGLFLVLTSIADPGGPLDILGKLFPETMEKVRKAAADAANWVSDKFDAIVDSIDKLINKVRELFGLGKMSLNDSIIPQNMPNYELPKTYYNKINGVGDGGPKVPLVDPAKMPGASAPATKGDLEKFIRGETGSNVYNINVTAPGADGKRIADQIRTEFQRKPLFDSDGALVPA